MPSTKSARVRMQDIVRKAHESGDSFLANEITANVMVGTTMVILFAVMLVCLILNEVGVFTADKVTMRWAVLIASIVEVPITVINSIYVGAKKWLKIPLMVDLIFVCAILSAALGHNITLVMVFPLVVSTRYFDEKYTRDVAILTALVFAIAGIASGFWGIVNLNMLRFENDVTLSVVAGSKIRDAISPESINRAYYTKELFFNEFIPRCIVFICLSVSCRYVASRGKRMIEMQSENVKKTARIATELDLATKIQTSMLPCIFPAFPEHEYIKLRAVYHPAKEVGGDFYDYFKIDETHVGVVIADVSGKGVGAALFMTISKTIIKNQLQLGISPAEALTNVNRQLCENNEAGLFVTCWAGVYDTEKGILTFVNAGHNPPVLLRKGGQAEYIKQRNGLVLAGLEDYQYKQGEIQLFVGDEIFFYTDGVTEATDSENALYGEQRLLDCLNGCYEDEVSKQIETVKGDIDAFVGDVEQFDDITIMAMRITSPEEYCIVLADEHEG